MALSCAWFTESLDDEIFSTLLFHVW